MRGLTETEPGLKPPPGGCPQALRASSPVGAQRCPAAAMNTMPGGSGRLGACSTSGGSARSTRQVWDGARSTALVAGRRRGGGRHGSPDRPGPAGRCRWRPRPPAPPVSTRRRPQRPPGRPCAGRPNAGTRPSILGNATAGTLLAKSTHLLSASSRERNGRHQVIRGPPVGWPHLRSARPRSADLSALLGVPQRAAHCAAVPSPGLLALALPQPAALLLVRLDGTRACSLGPYRPGDPVQAPSRGPSARAAP